MSEKQQFENNWDREYLITMKVLKAYPEGQQNWKPHEKSKSAIELAWTIAAEEKTFVDGMISGKIDFSKSPKVPATFKEALAGIEKFHAESSKKFKNIDEEELNKTMKFMVAKNKMMDVRKMDLMYGLLMDEVHHRGQFSVYVRMAGGKVPSIYGPSADEPWTEALTA